MNRNSSFLKEKLPPKSEQYQEGNRSLLQVTQIVKKHRIPLLVPASIVISASSFNNKLVYTDPVTLKLVVKTGDLNPTMIS